MTPDGETTAGKITGIGGVFVTSPDPEALKAWYRDKLGFDITDYGAHFRSADDPAAEQSYTLWSPFSNDTQYLKPSTKPFMINFRVDDLEAYVETLAARGVTLEGDGVVTEPYGKFAWVVDRDGTKLELWQQIGDAP